MLIERLMPPASAPAGDARLTALAARLNAYAARYESVRDSRCVFTKAYSVMTKIIADELPTRHFDDPQWVVELAEAFAQRYFEAMDAYDAGQSPGSAWTTLIEEIRNRHSSVLEDLVCAMTGHIVHDLPLALRDLAIDGGPDASHLRDYHQVNEILGDAIEPIKDAIERRYDPWLRWLDQLGQKHEEPLTNYGIRLSRAAAWYNACRLADPLSASDAAESIERSPVAFVDSVFRPPWLSVRLLLRAFTILSSLGRVWPRARSLPSSPPKEIPSQQYYFGTGTGRWRGTFRYRVVDWRRFWTVRLGRKNRFLALGMAVTMMIFRKARIWSAIAAYPDQGRAGVATNQVRISLLGITLYLLHEQYVLDPNGTDVYVRSRERFGPIPWLFNVDKAHPARVSQAGMHATYYIPLLGAEWIGEYSVRPDRAHIESVLTCAWACATESIDRRSAGG